MNEKTFKALLEASAVKQLRIIAQGSYFHIEVVTGGGSKVVMTARGDLRLWRSLEGCAKWVRKMGIGQATLDIARWETGQRSLV